MAQNYAQSPKQPTTYSELFPSSRAFCFNLKIKKKQPTKKTISQLFVSFLFLFFISKNYITIQILYKMCLGVFSQTIYCEQCASVRPGLKLKLILFLKSFGVKYVKKKKQNMLKFKKDLQFVAFMHLFSVPIRVKKRISYTNQAVTNYGFLHDSRNYYIFKDR